MISGTIFDIKRFAIHDGPGVRTTVFFKGCPLSCWACHNPEGQRPGSDLFLRDERCNACGDCLEVCQQAAISQSDAAVHVDRYRCDLCGACADACLRGALELAGRSVSVDEVIAEVERDVVYYDESGGGVTFSGGEPLFQPEFLEALLQESRKREISTVVDTSGYAPRSVLQDIADMVDHFLYDLKLADEARHREFTGVANCSILDNLNWLSEHGSSVMIRLPLLPEVNDDESNLSALGRFLSSLARLHPVDILPYHRTGADKYARLGRSYPFPQQRLPDADTIATAVQLLEQSGLTVTVRGETYAVE
ncbi:MAG: glycyl-radical enzyme activating protein [Gemmatimonadota bacterium]|nr:MAG: glycyl-radical enzyme activating protein [Gemmatimonadota bacterium]